MITKRNIKKRRYRKKIQLGFELPMTSLMDALVILVIFLLKSYHANPPFETPTQLHLPWSSSQTIPDDQLQVLITQDTISLEEKKIIEVKNISSLEHFEPLYQALVNHPKTKSSPSLKRTLTIQADRHTSYELLEQVMKTASKTGYIFFQWVAQPLDHSS